MAISSRFVPTLVEVVSMTGAPAVMVISSLTAAWRSVSSTVAVWPSATRMLLRLPGPKPDSS
jgi:hypothetical protein